MVLFRKITWWKLENAKRCFLFLKAIVAPGHGFSLLVHYIEFPLKTNYLQNES